MLESASLIVLMFLKAFVFASTTIIGANRCALQKRTSHVGWLYSPTVCSSQENQWWVSTPYLADTALLAWSLGFSMKLLENPNLFGISEAQAEGFYPGIDILLSNIARVLV